MRGMDDLLHELDQLGVAYVRVDHPAVFTVEESERLVPPMPGARTKNLFLRDKKGARHLLLVAAHDTARRPLGRLAASNCSRSGLGIRVGCPARRAPSASTPGSVEHPRALATTTGPARSSSYVDRDVWAAPTVLAHPLVNTATLAIARADLERFLRHTGHPAAGDRPADGGLTPC